ncbi:glucan biosynthesis protein [uncultured Methylobacterium sp.]|uniref:glucan biosynthesis protein n=1 Tax=uncultured Methylobacterium sp. TaxID=157278 RepID=UPI0035CBD998
MREGTETRGVAPGPARPQAPPEAGGAECPSRRRVLRTALTAAAGSLVPSAIDLNGDRTRAQESPGAQDAGGAPTTFADVAARAERLAAAAYVPPPEDLPAPLAALTYDGYRAIVFRPAAGLRLGHRFSAQLFHRGFLQRKRVALFVQPRTGPARPVAYASGLFDLGPTLAGRSFPADLGFAGFRLHYAATDAPAGRPPGFQEEFLVFLGAAYFRLRGEGQEYGLSARAAAIGTGSTAGEEFPDFTAHWIVEPEEEAGTITVLSLLDGPSLAGAYRFDITPGDPARIRVTAALHPRKPIAQLGLAPLTSMFLHGQNGPGARGAKPFDDFRPQVHDSDGLLVRTAGDRLWRPLTNGRRDPQISAFRAAPLEGFGLMQRERNFDAYRDVEARHEARPGLWVEPAEAPRPGTVAAGVFASGAVQLFEIPSVEEYMDNVVAAFVPDAPVVPGRPIAVAYGLTTVGAEPVPLLGALARVVSTRVGSAERLRPTDPPSPERRLYVVDFEGPDLPRGAIDAEAAGIAAVVSATAGTMHDPVAAPVPQTGGWRLYVEWRPPNPLPPGDVVLRAHLTRDGRRISETWDAAG